MIWHEIVVSLINQTEIIMYVYALGEIQAFSEYDFLNPARI